MSKEINEGILQGAREALAYAEDERNNRLIASRLPENLDEVAIDLAWLKLTRIPPESMVKLTEYPNLESLSLQLNYLDELPDLIGDLAKLKYISLHSNRLTKLPDSFGNLMELERIHLSNNKFTKLPEFLGLLPNLRQLSLGTMTPTMPESLRHPRPELTIFRNDWEK